MERSLEINLDDELHSLADSDGLISRVSGAVERFGIKGDEKNGMASIVRATRLYTQFKRHQAHA